jgi:hypothetical protein
VIGGKLGRFCIDRPQIFSGVALPSGGHTWSLAVSPSISSLSEGTIRASVATIGDDASRHAADVIGRILSKTSDGELKGAQIGEQYRRALPKGPSLKTVLLLYHERFQLIDTDNVGTFMVKLKTTLREALTPSTTTVAASLAPISAATQVIPIGATMPSTSSLLSSVSIVPPPSLVPLTSTPPPVGAFSLAMSSTNTKTIDTGDLTHHHNPMLSYPLPSSLTSAGVSPPPYKEAIAVLHQIPDDVTPKSSTSSSSISLPISVNVVNDDIKRSVTSSATPSVSSSFSSHITLPKSEASISVASSHDISQLTTPKLLTFPRMPAHLLATATKSLIDDSVKEIFQYLPDHIHHSILQAANDYLSASKKSSRSIDRLTEIQFQLGQLPMLKLNNESNDEFIDLLDLPHDWYDAVSLFSTHKK